MTSINFRRTTKGYSADFQHDTGHGFERLYFRRDDVSDVVRRYGWDSPDDIVQHGFGGITAAEYFIAHQVVRPYRRSRIV